MKKVLWGIAIALAMVAMIGVVLSRSAAEGRKRAEANKDKGYSISRGDLKVQVVETGSIDAVKSVEVKSQVDGRVQKLLVEEGQVVNKGDLIAVIDPQETQLRVEQDRAQLRGAQSAVARTSVEIRQRRVTAQAAFERAKIRVSQLEAEVKAQPKLTQAAIESAEANYRGALERREKIVKVEQPNDRASVETALNDAKAGLQNAQRDLDRKKSLHEKGYISLRELQDAELQLTLAQSRLETAQTRKQRLQDQESIALREADEQLSQARAELDRARTNRIQDRLKQDELKEARQTLRDAEAGLLDVQALEASQAQSQASVDQISSGLRESERRLRETEIRAPVTGIVTKKLVQVGELVAGLNNFSSGTAIVRVEDREGMLVKLNINEIDVAKLKLGMKSEIKVDAIPNAKFAGEVIKIAPSRRTEANQAAGNAVVKYEVEIRFDQPSDQLKTGMSARCSVLTLERKNVLRIATEYLGQDDEGFFVNLKSDPKKKVRVTVGARTGAFAEILDGVKEGDQVVKPEFGGPGRVGAFGGGGDI